MREPFYIGLSLNSKKSSQATVPLTTDKFGLLSALLFSVDMKKVFLWMGKYVRVDCLWMRKPWCMPQY
jgi:hypothetical protein